MDQWDIPSCSICYEKLLSDLSLLPNCGHIYHKDCLRSWLERINFNKASCPLCRKPLDLNGVIPLNYSIAKASNSNRNEPTSDVASPEETEIQDLKLRLNKSATDNLDLLQKLHTLQNEKENLVDSLNFELTLKESVIQENRDLKYSQEKHKTTIFGLNNKVVDLKDKLKKLDHLSKYLESHKNLETDQIRNFLNPFTADEKINILVNRIQILESMVKELNDLNEKIKLERDQIDKNFKNTRREFINMYNFYNPPQVEEKEQLPGLDNQDFMNETYENRRRIDKALNKTKDSTSSGLSTPDKFKSMHPLKRTLTPTPDREKKLNPNSKANDTIATPSRLNPLNPLNSKHVIKSSPDNSIAIISPKKMQYQYQTQNQTLTITETLSDSPDLIINSPFSHSSYQSNGPTPLSAVGSISNGKLKNPTQNLYSPKSTPTRDTSNQNTEKTNPIPVEDLSSGGKRTNFRKLRKSSRSKADPVPEAKGITIHTFFKPIKEDNNVN